MAVVKGILVFVAAAMLEVWGDSNIRDGFDEKRSGLVVLGAVMLGAYGIVVNLVPSFIPKLDFAELLGIYIFFFALASVLWSWLVRGQHISKTTWLGIVVIAVGGLIIQLGMKRAV